MAATTIDGPEFVYGNLANIEGGVFGAGTSGAVPDPNQDAGPSLFFQGDGILDPRLIFLKDKIQGFTGSAQGFFAMDILESVRQIPYTHQTNTIVNAQNAVSGAALPMVTNQAMTGAFPGIPIRAFSPVLNSGAIQTATVLDFGFGYATATNGSTSVTAAGNIWDYFPGMPIVMTDSSGHAVGPLLTFITAVNYSAGSFTINNAFQGTTGVVCIGTGDLWGPSEANPSTGGFPLPQSAYPFMANGPALMLDSRQALMRGISVTGTVAGCTGGNFLISGADVYGSPQTQLLTVGAGAVTAYTLKTFKSIYSVVPQFNDAHAYSVGTSDLISLCFRASLFEDLALYYTAAWVSTAGAGFVPGVLTQPSTNLLGDVRGTLQFGAIGPGTTVTGAASFAGSLSTNVMSGSRVELSQQITMSQAIQAEQLTPYYLMGVTPA